jgi:enoyl-[acyl-carrier protein] reductase/trans-2-enoyl-CoA reductase (NAD+)
MAGRIISPTGRGFLLLDAHPVGCAQLVSDLAAQVPVGPEPPATPPVALVIGSSAGYGLATIIAGLARHAIDGVGVAFERPPGRRTATAGWYRTIATDALAAQHGRDLAFINADAFADTTKDDVLDLIAKRHGGLDYLVYSVAAPRRTDPRSGATYQSVIKSLEGAHTTKTLEFDADGAPLLRSVAVEPATREEAAATVQVMGGEDWARWIARLAQAGLLRHGFRTVALSYIGSSLTAAIYRSGTIGAAKEHLEQTAVELNERLASLGGRALTSVNGAAVTQASTAIPGIALYVSLLRGVLGERMQSPVEQSVRLWDQLTGAAPLDLDEQGRLRLDGWELADDVQAAVADRWHAATPETISGLADVAWFRTQFRQLYGFDVPGVDYDQPVDPDLAWPGAATS